MTCYGQFTLATERLVMRPRKDLSAAFLRSALDYDPLTGVFRWRQRPNRSRSWNTRFAGKPAGAPCGPHGSVQIRLNRRCYLGHRLAWLHAYGAWPRDEVDHVNGDPGDNRLANLREATHGENMLNLRKPPRAASGFRGVRYRAHHGKWEARIHFRGRTVWRGYFASAQEAAAARRAMVPVFYGNFAPPG